VQKKNVFIFPCGSEIGLELHKSLQYSTHFNLIGGSSVDDHGKFVFQEYVDGLPFVDDTEFTDKINAIIDEHHIDFIFPAHDSVMLKLAQEKAASKLHCEVITSPAETCEVARSKRHSYERLVDVIPTPKVYKNLNNLQDGDFPIFLKPDVGQGTKGTFIAKDKQDVDFYTQKDPSLLLLEYLPDKEYTIDCFTNKNGQLLFAEGRQRIRISNGISVNSTTVDDVRFREVAEKINRTLTFRGVWFFQLKERVGGELVLMEIAPRVAGTMGLVRCKGVNLPLLSLFDAMGYDVSVFENKGKVIIDRALQNCYKHDIQYKHVYLDFDDLVIFEGKVNPVVMAFVYQCINKNITIHLLTKHKDDLHKTLQKYRLDKTFDDIIWVTNDDAKPGRITEHDAIFIDDSFAERRRVHDELGIPTFDAHAIESLMEKF
jgi:hypothetical protein